MKKLVAGSTAVMLMLSGYLTSCKSTPTESSSKSKTAAESSAVTGNKNSRTKESDDSEAVVETEVAVEEKVEEPVVQEEPVQAPVVETKPEPVAEQKPAEEDKSFKADKKEDNSKVVTTERKDGTGVISSTAVVKDETDDIYNPPNSEENFPETMKRINPNPKPNTAANLQDGTTSNRAIESGKTAADSNPNTAANLQDGTAGNNGTNADKSAKSTPNTAANLRDGTVPGTNSGSGSNQPRLANNTNNNKNGSGANGTGANSNGSNGASADANKNGAGANGSGSNANANGTNSSSNKNGNGANSNANGTDGNGTNANGSGANGTGANSANAGAGTNKNGAGVNGSGNNANDNGVNGNKNGSGAGANGNGANVNGSNSDKNGSGANANGSNKDNGANGTGTQLEADNLDKYRTWYSPAMNDVQRCGYFYTTPEICKFSMIEGAFKKISGYNKSAYGFVFGYSEPNGRMLKDYIRFEINVDGEYALYTWDGKNYTDLVEKNSNGTAYFYKNSAIQKGYNAQNKIKIVNNGNTFSVYVNNTLIQSNIPALKNGTKGVMAFFSVGKPDQEDLPATPVNVSMKITDAQRAN